MSTASVTRLEGSLRIPAAATLRLVYDPAGSATAIDLSVSVGTLYYSHDAFLAVWQALCTALVPGVWSMRVERGAHGGGYVVIDTPGAKGVTITWSHAGDGTAVRDWLGGQGLSTSRASGEAFADPCQGCWIPYHPARRIARSDVRTPRAHMDRLDGWHVTQHDASAVDPPDVRYQVTLWVSDDDDVYEAMGRWEQFLLDLASVCDQETFTLYHGTEVIPMTIEGEEVTIPTSLVGGKDILWSLNFPARSVYG